MSTASFARLSRAAVVRAVVGNSLLPTAVLLSGAASLMYQVAWARRLASVMSSTPAAQALVVGVFLAGLGLGATWAGLRCGKVRRPLLGYAAVELGAAACAAISFPALHASSPGAPVLLTGAASSAFLVTTAGLLGASLPFVLEHVERTRTSGNTLVAKDRMVGLLYGTNTLGAVFGALLAGFVTIERYGLRATTIIGGGFASCAVVVASCLAGVAAPGVARTVSVAPSPRGTAQRLDARLVICASLAGLAGVGSEIVYTRLLALIVHNTVYAFAEVLAGVLLGIAAGGFLAATLTKRKPATPHLLFAATLGLAGAAVLIAASPSIAVWLAGMQGFDAGVASGSFESVLAVFAIVAPPAALIAAVLPLLVVSLRASSSSEAFGLLYGANTGGSVVGSLLVGFGILPWLGLAVAVSAMSVAALAAGAFLLVGAGRPRVLERTRTGRWVLAGAAVVVVAFHASHHVPRAVYEAHLPAGVSILDFQESTVSDVMVTEDHQGHRRLWINSAWVAGTGGGHRMLGDLPPLFVPEPRRGLGIALGTGQTFAAMFRHGLSTLDCVEINPSVIDLSKRWFGDANDHLFDTPGVIVHRDDGRAFLRATDQRYDLIVLEPLQAWTAGTANLYSREFYEEARRALAPGGVVAQWIPFYGQTEVDTRAMVRAGADVFHSASLWLDENDGILILSDAPFVLDSDALHSRIQSRGVDALLAKNDVTSMSDLLGLFVMGPAGIHRWVGDAPVMDDDHPFLEFSAARNRTNPNRHSIFASARDGAEDPAVYSSANATNASDVARSARAVQQALLELGTLPGGDYESATGTIERALLVAPNSGLLSARYGKEILGWAESFGKDSAQARNLYEWALKHDPKQGEVLMALAQLDEKAGRRDDARQLLLRAEEVPRVVREAKAALESMSGRN